MTDPEKIKAAKAAYARDWRKRNPERAKQIQQRYWEKKAERGVEVGKETTVGKQ